MITKEDYREMEVLVNGEWIKADVLKVLSNGMAIYLVGSKNSNGGYYMGSCAPAESCREIEPPKPKTKTVVKSKVDLLELFLREGYKKYLDVGYKAPYGFLFRYEMFDYCGESPSPHNYLDEWLEEVEIEEDDD